MSQPLTIAAEDPKSSALVEVSRWLNREWGQAMGYGPAETEAWCRGVAAAPGEAVLVAHLGGAPAGVAMLVADDLHDMAYAALRSAPEVPVAPALTPWLAALFVIPEARRRGVGARLVGAVVDAAARRGHGEIFLYARRGVRTDYYRRLGWCGLESHLLVDAAPPRSGPAGPAPREFEGGAFLVMQRSVPAAPRSPAAATKS